MALIATVTVSSIVSAQFGGSTPIVTADVFGSRSITGCSIRLDAAYLDDPNDGIVSSYGRKNFCAVKYTNNITSGYGITYIDADTDTTLRRDPNTDSIAALVESTTTATYCGAASGGVVAGSFVNKAVREDCWSFLLGAKTDTNATFPLDMGQGPAGVAFNSGEHSINPSNGSMERIIQNAGTTANGSFSVDFWFEAQIDALTRTTPGPTSRYSATTIATIGN